MVSNNNHLVIMAGGVGSRFWPMSTSDMPKQFIDVYGKPIIIHTLELFENHPEIDAIAVACLEDWIPYLKDLLEKFNIKKVKKVVPGGASGQESIYNGLKAAEEIANGEKSIVLIHDGVRPLINEKTITDNIESVKKHGSSITCVKVKETVLVVAKDNSIKDVPNREDTRLARAPQSFYLDEIIGAHRKAMAENKYDFIDSCSMMQYYGKKLYLIEGPQENIKITTPDDFYTMRALLDAREEAQIYGLEN